MEYFEEIMKSSCNIDGSKHSCTEQGESLRNREPRNTTSKEKPTCYHYGKLGHTTNICQSKHGIQNPKPKFIGYCFYCKKQGHQIHDPRFEGYFYNCQKYGHRAYGCKLQKTPYWKNQRQNYAPNNAFSKCHKFAHSRKNCRTQVPSKNHIKGKGKSKMDIEKVNKEMNKIWRDKVEYGNSGENGVEVTQSNGEYDHVISN